MKSLLHKLILDSYTVIAIHLFRDLENKVFLQIRQGYNIPHACSFSFNIFL